MESNLYDTMIFLELYIGHVAITELHVIPW